MKKIIYILLISCIVSLFMGCTRIPADNTKEQQKTDSGADTEVSVSLNDSANDAVSIVSDGDGPAYPEYAYPTEEDIAADEELEQWYKDNDIVPDVHDDNDPITTGVMIYNIDEILDNHPVNNLMYYMTHVLDRYFEEMTEHKPKDYIITIASGSYKEEFSDIGDLIIDCKGAVQSEGQFPDDNIEIKFNTQTGRFTFITPSYGAISYTMEEYVDQMN